MRLLPTLAFALFLPSVATAAPRGDDPAPLSSTGASDRLTEAVRLLSRYPTGLVPVEPGVMLAIRVVSELGTADEVSLLRSLVENERQEVKAAATEAIARIRDRQHDDQRETFADSLPNWPELLRGAESYEQRGLGQQEAICAAYAATVLGTEVGLPPEMKRQSGDARDLLAAGRPYRALSATLGKTDADGRLLAARAQEDLADVHAAIRSYAWLAAEGNADARDALDGYGIDAERLLLGMLSVGQRVSKPANDAAVFEVLIHHGDDLTVTVLAERIRSRPGSESAWATDALARMLDPQVRESPLPTIVQREAHQAILAASREGPEPIQAIAAEALKTARAY